MKKKKKLTYEEIKQLYQEFPENESDRAEIVDFSDGTEDEFQVQTSNESENNNVNKEQLSRNE